MAAVRTLLAAATAASAAAAARSSVSIDLGWRFRRGPPPPAPGPCVLATNFSGTQCNGLSAAPQAASAADCAAACCADSLCQIWQWTTPGAGGGCWIGAIPPAGCNDSPAWTSFGNATRGSGGAVPDWAALDYPADAGANWSVVDAPHDFIITGADEAASPYVDDSSLQGQAFIPKTVGIYRKHFALPAAWQGSHVELYCEGMYAFATYYLNGQPLGVHALGYTSFFARLDNVTGGLFYDGRDNVLAVLVDATAARDTGWWYEGGGAMRHTFLTSSAPAAHVVPHGLHADVAIDGPYHFPAAPSDGVTADGVTVLCFADIETDGAAAADVVASFALFAADGVTVIASGAAKSVSVPPAPGASATASVLLTLPPAAQCWSVARPYLHTLVVTLALASAPGAVLDSANATIGLRGVRFDADEGSFVNEQRVRLRAFCDHESFSAVGMAIPLRLQLFRMQAMRGMGGNGRRFSHNPPAPDLLDITDRLGVLTLDENRVFSVGLDGNMADLVARDRNHPSVMFWSFCNEPGCNNTDKSAPTEPTQAFKFQVEQFDGTRAVTGNMCIGWGSCPDMDQYVSATGLNMSLQLDVQGFSHVDSASFAAYHARWPAKPLVASECCSCETQRGEADDIPYNKSLVFYSELNADCQAQQTQWALGLDYVAGSFVWVRSPQDGACTPRLAAHHPPRAIRRPPLITMESPTRGRTSHPRSARMTSPASRRPRSFGSGRGGSQTSRRPRRTVRPFPRPRPPRCATSSRRGRRTRLTRPRREACTCTLTPPSPRSRSTAPPSAARRAPSLSSATAPSPWTLRRARSSPRASPPTA